MTLQEIQSREDVQAIQVQTDRMIEEAGDLPVYKVTQGMSEIEACACDPYYWAGTLQYKMWERSGLTEEEIDLLLNQ